MQVNKNDVSGLLGIGSWPHLSTTSICPRAVVSSREFVGFDAATPLCIRDASKTAGATGGGGKGVGWLVGWRGRFWCGGWHAKVRLFVFVVVVVGVVVVVVVFFGGLVGESDKGENLEVGTIISTFVCLFE